MENKIVRRSGEIFQLFGKNQGSIPHLAERIKRSAIPIFAEDDSSLAVRLLTNVKQIDLICFQIFRAIIPVLLLINSLPGARGREEGARKEERGSEKERRDG